jgi:recombination protein RecA
MGTETNIIDKSGSWYSYGGERIGQGRENVKNFLKENPDIYNDLFIKTKDALGLSGKQEESVQNED